VITDPSPVGDLALTRTIVVRPLSQALRHRPAPGWVVRWLGVPLPAARGLLSFMDARVGRDR